MILFTYVFSIYILPPAQNAFLSNFSDLLEANIKDSCEHDREKEAFPEPKENIQDALGRPEVGIIRI